MASHKDLSVVLVQSTLIITDSRHVLDHDGVIRMLAFLVKNRVGFDHVINDVGLGDLLGAELLLGAEILSVVVAEMVVAGNGGELDTSADQEIDQCRLHLGLTRLEIITTNEGVVLLSKLNSTGNEGVLWGAIDESNTLKDTSHSEDSGWSHLLVTVFDCFHKILGSVVDARNEISKTLSVGSPLNNDGVQVIGSLEVTGNRLAAVLTLRLISRLPNVLANLLNMLHGSLATLDEVVGTILLIGSNEVRVVDAGKRNHAGHLLLDLILEGRFENSSSVHIPGNFRQIGPLFAFKFPKICPRPAFLSLRSPKSDRLLACNTSAEFCKCACAQLASPYPHSGLLSTR